MNTRRWIGFAFLLVATVVGINCAARYPSVLKLSATAEKRPPETIPFPVPIIELRGDATEMGSAHGCELGAQIRDLHERYMAKYFNDNNARRMIAMTMASAFQAKLVPEHQQEIAALAAAAAIEPQQMMLAQCFLDLSAITACSTITLPASFAPDGVARFGRNLDFPSFNIADKHTIVLIYHPAGRYRFAAVSWPGLVGVLSGMNEHGLALANMEIIRGKRLPTAMPYTLLYRMILERCATVEEAIETLQSTPRQTPNNLMLMDARGDRAVVEITPDSVHVRRGQNDAPLISTNHHRGQDWMTPGRCDRYDLLLERSRRDASRIDRNVIVSMLRDAAQGKMTLQSMIFEPSTRTMYLATGANAPTHPFGRLDLKQYFR